MKKVLLIITLLALGFAATAQVDSVTLLQAQAQQQALEQQKALEQQQALEQKALEQQEALMAKQMKEAKRAERREKIGRKAGFSIDPSLSLGVVGIDYQSLYQSQSVDLGLGVLYHYPVARRWDLNAGLAYRFTSLNLYNSVRLASDGLTLVEYTPATHLTELHYINHSSIDLPLFLSHVGKDKKSDQLYFGFRFGYGFGAKFHYTQYSAKPDSEDPNGEVKTSAVETSPEGVAYGKKGLLRPLSCRLVVGLQERGKLFSTGAEFYFDLIPTYREAKLHTFGVRIHL